MRSTQVALSVLTVLCFWSNLLWAVRSSVLSDHRPRFVPRQYQRINSKRSPSLTASSNNEIWPDFPFTIAINQKDSTPEWLRFSNGTQFGTQEQNLTLSSLIRKLSTTFVISPTTILNDMSKVGDQDVSVNFKLTPRLLDGKSFSSAVDKFATCVKQWGAKEMDLEVGSGPQDSAPEGVFHIRLGPGSSTLGTGISTSLPFINFSVPATGLGRPTSAALTTATNGSSGAASIPTGNSTGFPALASSVPQALPPTFTSGAPSNNQPAGNGTITNSKLSSSSLGPFSSGPGAGSPQSGTRSPLNTVTPSSIQTTPVTPTTSGASNGGLVAAGGSGDTGSRDKDAAAAGAAAAAHILATGGDIAAAAAAASAAASASVATAGGDAAAAASAATAAEAAAKSSSENENENEEDGERRRLSLSLEHEPATTTPETTAPETTTPAATTLVTATPAITTLATRLSNGTMTSQIASSTCAACATCPGFEFGANWPDLGSTTSWASAEMDTEDDWHADIDDDEFSPEDADGEEGDVPDSEGLTRRTWAGRFHHSAHKKRHLHKRVVAAKKSTKLGQCDGFNKFVDKPSYYNAKNVADFEATPDSMEKIDEDFMEALVRWIIPIKVPPGDCTTVPKWAMLRTDQCKGDAPLPDGSTFSKVVGVGEQVWQVGGAPNKINVNREVNIDHVYEAKYLSDFFSDLNLNQGFTCGYLKTVWDSPNGARLTNLFANLPSKTNVEFIGMSKDLNSLKEALTNKLWNKDLPLSWVKYGAKDKTTGTKGPDLTLGLAFTIFGKDANGNEVSFDPANDLNELTSAAQILDLVNTPDAIKYMSAPNDRIYTALQAIGVPCQGGPSWADRYKSYILNRFATRNVQVQDLFTRVLAELGPAYRSDYVAAWRKVYPLERMQLPPPTSWATEFPAIQQAIQAEFTKNPASLGKRQAAAARPAVAACMLNENPTATTGTTSPTVSGSPDVILGAGLEDSGVIVDASGVPNQGGTTANVKPSTSPASIPLPLSASSSAPALLTTIATTTPLPIVSTPATSSPSTATSAAPANGDPCGPAIQDNPNYPNTCDAKVSLTTTPAAYGVYCGSDAPSSINWSGCEAAYKATCASMQDELYPKGGWIWSDPGTGCAVGVWLPPGTDTAGSGVAKTPSEATCHDLIFKAMTDSCATTTSPSNVGSVNLSGLPSFRDKSQTGTQVNVGYPSYIIAPKSPRGLTHLPGKWGWADTTTYRF